MGVSSRFAADGKPQPLPAQYVPDAYRQWNVQLYDWQTVVTSKADPDAPGKLQLVCRRLMPTVGCEPDYVAYFEDRSGDAEASKGAAAVTHTPILPQLEVAIAEDDGSYISGGCNIMLPGGNSRGRTNTSTNVSILAWRIISTTHHRSDASQYGCIY